MKAFEKVSDSIQRLKLSFAAYNCGLGHVQDAQKLAEFKNLDPCIWEANVEPMLLELRHPRNYNLDFIKHGYVRGSEPVNYVNQIFERFEQYKTFIK